MKKKILGLVLVLCMLFSMVVMPVQAATSGTCGDNLTWTLDNGTLTISGTGRMYSYIDTFPWDSLKGSIKTVTVQYGATNIYDRAFYNCKNLDQITLPDSIEYIGTDAFYGTAYFQYEGNWENNMLYIGNYLIKVKNTVSGEFAVDDGTQTIGSGAFNLCGELTKIIIPDTVRFIGNGAFAGCTKLQSIRMPSDLAYISDYLFAECERLAEVTIPSSVTSIGIYAFYGCRNLARVIIPEKVTYIDSYAFSGCENFTEFIIPNNVERVGSGLFSNCHNLVSVKLSTRVRSIEFKMFSDCRSLSNITIHEYIQEIDDCAFYNCDGLTKVTIPVGVETIGEYAFFGCDNITSIDIPDGVVRIGRYAFADCLKLASFSIADSVIAIGENAFYNTLYFNNSDNWYNGEILYIGHHLVRASRAISEATIRDGTLTLADYAFEECDSLTQINIPDSLRSISYYAFKDCRNLISVDIPESVKSIGEYAFYGCSNLASVTIQPYSISSIDSGVFGYCSSLASIVIPKGVIYVRSGAFSRCSSLKDVTIPKSVVDIGFRAFYDCDSLTDVYYGGNANDWLGISISTDGNEKFRIANMHYNAETIPDEQDKPANVVDCGTFSDNLTWTFYDNDTLVIGGTGEDNTTPGKPRPWAHLNDFIGNVVIENGVTNIAEYAFYCCSLESVTIGDSVTSIGDYAFGGCGKLTNINVSDENENYASVDGVLFNKNKTTIIKCPEGRTEAYTVPDSVTIIGYCAFDSCYMLESVTVSDNVTNISYQAFCYCDNLKSITIGNSVTSIGSDAFYGCRALSDVYYKGTQEQWDDISIYTGNDYLLNANMHYNTGTIPDEQDKPANVVDCGTFSDNLTWTFYDNGTLVIGGTGEDNAYPYYPWNYLYSSVEKVIIENGVTSIGGGAFWGCNNLTSITIPNSVTSIGDYAFSACSSLTSITIPDSVTSIGYYAFWDCSSLTSITIPNSVTSIGDSAFSGCSSLTSITIPDSVTSIGNFAFAYCSSLTSITILDSVTSIGGGAFWGCNNLTDVYYSGTEEDWNKISIETFGNDSLINATRHYIPSIKLTDNGTSFTVIPKNISAGNSIIFAVYKDGKMVDMQTKSYDGTDSVFSVTVPYDTVKAMVWKNLTSMEPLCPLKTIAQ